MTTIGYWSLARSLVLQHQVASKMTHPVLQHQQTTRVGIKVKGLQSTWGSDSLLRV
jgi:hypothetical protein